MTAMHLMNSRVIALVRGVPKSFAKVFICVVVGSFGNIAMLTMMYTTR